jgi:hypothetical protein
MTDLELVRNCAKIVGVTIFTMEDDPDKFPYYYDDGAISYWPLTNKAQASDLQDALKLTVLWDDTTGKWGAASYRPTRVSYNADKLRAICECAAAKELK